MPSCSSTSFLLACGVNMKNSEILMKRLREIYEERTKIPSKKLNELLKHDLWWDAETCLKYGLVDEIIY